MEIKFNKIIKSSDFRHLCDNVCSKEVFLLCFTKFFALVLFQRWEKSDIKNRIYKYLATMRVTFQQKGT